VKPESKCFLVLATMVGAWQESGENPAIFCYLMMWGASAVLRERAAILTPAFARLAACWKPSVTFFTRSIAQTNSRN
jgi:hypothetical protein